MNRFVAGREPALLATLVGVVLKLAAAFLVDLSAEQQGLFNAVIAAGVGLIIAWSTRDGFSAGLLGLVQAVVALAIGFGLKIDPDDQALIMSAFATAVGMYTRTQVTAPEPPEPPEPPVTR